MGFWWRFLWLALAAGAGAFSYLASTQPSFGWDGPGAEWVQGWDVRGLGRFMEVVSWSGIYLVAAVSWVLTLLLALRWGGWRLGAVVLAAALLDLANDGVKALVGRPRPFGLAETDSFPSGHTVHAVLFLGVLWLLLAPRLHRRWRRAALGGLFVLLGLLVGVSRVYLGRHWPSDVLGAYLVGGLALWGLGWAAAARGWLARKR